MVRPWRVRRARAAPDLAEDHRLLAVDEIGDVGLVGPVDVPAGIVGQQVQHGVDAHGLQGGQVLRPDPVEPVDPDLGQLRERGGRPGLGHDDGPSRGMTATAGHRRHRTGGTGRPSIGGAGTGAWLDRASYSIEKR